MRKWSKYPSIFEINTSVWLSDLSRKYGKPIELGSVPSSEWDAIGALGFDAVWLMGVWERSPASIAIANVNRDLLDDFRRALPDFQLADNVGSAYCIRRYVADRHLGGPEGLATARGELAQRGIRLILDFVPNHLATDHPWVSEHPDYFIRGTPNDATNDPASYILLNGVAFAYGRDPLYPAWQDVLQVNAFQPALRRAATETLADIASQSDGVRCDMAMLLLNSIFESTWAGRAGPRPPTEYWQDIISSVKGAHPDFLFIAEAYWDTEWTLQQQGFDFCYDKRLYDRLAHENAESVRLHLGADPAYQDRLLRFIENHDEPRAAATFPPDRERAAAIVAATLPGARLIYEGQLEGRKVRPPVFLRRRPVETADPALSAFYGRLLRVINTPLFREGKWSLCNCTGWPDNSSYRNLVAWTWVRSSERYLVAVNLSDSRSQARIQMGWDGPQWESWHLSDVLSGVTFDRSGAEIRDAGLYVELEPWGAHFFRCSDNRDGTAAHAG